MSYSELPGLGITGYPPERSIYESLLLQSGMHRKTRNGWLLCRPTDPGLEKAWNYIEDKLSSDELKPTVIKELFNDLSSPPYGLASGFIPILLCAFLLVNTSTVAIYESGVFVPYLSIALMDRLIKRPQHFSIVAFQITGERAAVVDRFAHGYGVDMVYYL